MDELRTGIRKDTGKYTTFINWGKGETKYLTFVTPIDQIPKVKFHNFVKIPDDSAESGFRWGTYMCRKDPAWRSQSGGKCFLCDSVGLSPAERYIAVAVELEPEFEGKRVKGLSIKYKTTDDGKQYPQIGVVIQSGNLFYDWLGAYQAKRGNVDEISFEIFKEGSQLDTKYLFFPIEEKPDLSSIEDQLIDLKATLEKMGSEETYQELEQTGIRAEDQPKFGGKDDKKKSGTNTQSPEPTVDEDEFKKLSAELGLDTTPYSGSR